MPLKPARVWFPLRIYRYKLTEHVLMSWGLHMDRFLNSHSFLVFIWKVWESSLHNLFCCFMIQQNMFLCSFFQIQLHPVHPSNAFYRVISLPFQRLSRVLALSTDTATSYQLSQSSAFSKLLKLCASWRCHPETCSSNILMIVDRAWKTVDGMEIRLEVSGKLKMELSYDPVVPHLGTQS